MAKIGRNDPCPCGSGTKYKRCHGRLGTARPLPRHMEPIIQKKMREMEAEHVQRERQQGLGKGIISTAFNGGRVVCVGNNVFHSKSWKTFHDFLRYYIVDRLGRGWFQHEHEKPDEQRHPIVRWYAQSMDDFRKSGVKEGEIYSGPMIGAQRAFLNLAYNLYLIEHHADVTNAKALLATFIDKLKSARADDFIGKLFETYAAAAHLKAGFKIDYENENDGNSSHVEFVATYPKTGRKFSVEVKSRNRAGGSDDDGQVDDVKRLRVGNKLNKALGKVAKHDRVVMIEINVPDVISAASLASGWPRAALAQVRHAEGQPFPDGAPKPNAYVIVTNHAFHNNLPDPDVGTQGMAIGFKIADFGPDVPFASYKDFREARERHSEIHALMASMRTHYEIPATFDGTHPELAFLPDGGLPPLKFGNRYVVPTADGTEIEAELEDATVDEHTKTVFGTYRAADGHRFMVTTPITDAELAAYRKHPETFFGEVRRVGRKVESFLDLCDFFYESYKDTPRERLLEFLKGAPDFADLKELPQRELSIICCERWARNAFNKTTKKPSAGGDSA